MSTMTALATTMSLLFGYLPAAVSSTPSVPTIASTDVEILVRDSYVDSEGRQIAYSVWLEDGEVGADVSIQDPATGDWLEMWLENETFRFEGVSDGEPISGAEPASSFYDTDPGSPACVGVIALVCIGAAVVLAGPGCQHLSFCVPTDGGTSHPDSPNEGGGGDGESDGDGDGDN